MRRVVLLFLLGACAGSSASSVPSAPPAVSALIASSAPVEAASSSAPIATTAPASSGPVVCQEVLDRQAREPRRTRMCASGDFEICFKLARDLLASGDQARAVAPLDQACGASMAEACRERALLDAPVDGGAAGKLALLDRSCKLDDGAGCHLAAVQRWTRGDTAGARRDLARGCEQGFSPSCSLLGWMNDAGEGGRRDLREVRRLFRRSAHGVDLGGCHRLASHVASGARSGMSMCDRAGYSCPAGCQDDCARQAAWQRRTLIDPLDEACRSGRKLACLVIASTRSLGLHIDGIGLITEEEEMRLSLVAITKLCEGGMGIACGSAGIFESFRDEGAHLARADDLFERGCTGGDSASCVYLGKALEKGEGRPQDARKALSLYERACSLGSLMTCRDLARMYRDGEGVKADAARAAAFAKAGEEL